MAKEDPGFVAGVAYALATLNKLHDQPGMCADVLAQSGLRVEDFRKVDAYDGMEIRKIYQQEAFRVGNHKHTMALRGERPRMETGAAKCACWHSYRTCCQNLDDGTCRVKKQFAPV